MNSGLLEKGCAGVIKVTIELLRFGIPELKKHLGTAIISNDGSGMRDSGNYDYMLSKWGKPDEPWKKGTLKSFPRQERGPWDLLYLVLRDAVGKRNEPKLLKEMRK